MIELYGLKHCTTCQKAKNYLTQQGVAFSEIDIRDNPPAAEAVELALAKSGGNPRKIINTSGELYREMGLKDKLAALGHEELVTLLTTHGMLLKRPFIVDVDGKRTTSGAKEEVLAAVWVTQ